jgi:hypothetical protein
MITFGHVEQSQVESRYLAANGSYFSFENKLLRCGPPLAALRSKRQEGYNSAVKNMDYLGVE